MKAQTPLSNQKPTPQNPQFHQLKHVKEQTPPTPRKIKIYPSILHFFHLTNRSKQIFISNPNSYCLNKKYIKTKQKIFIFKRRRKERPGGEGSCIETSKPTSKIATPETTHVRNSAPDEFQHLPESFTAIKEEETARTTININLSSTNVHQNSSKCSPIKSTSPKVDVFLRILSIKQKYQKNIWTLGSSS